MENDSRDSSSGFDADTLLGPGTQRALRQLPRLLGQAVRLVWRAAPRELLLSVTLQVVGSIALGAQVLVARSLLNHLLEKQSSRDFSSAIPSIIILVVILAVSGIVTVLRTEMQRLLSELVSWKAMQQVISAATAADLVSFENPAFHDRLQRSIVNASIRPLQMTTGLLTVGASFFASAAVGVTLLFIQPFFFGLALVSVAPVTIVTLRSVGPCTDLPSSRPRPIGSACTSSRSWWKRIPPRRFAPTAWEPSSKRGLTICTAAGSQHFAD